MDYRFYYNERQLPCAALSMDHEAFGLWLTDDLSDNSEQLDELLDAITRLDPDRPVRVMAEAGSLAFDGEREIAFTAADAPTVTLRTDAFRTVDVEACMAHAAAEGLFFDRMRAPAANTSA